ncbi:MAG: DNA/RNA non-specific endonuclease [Flavobacteriales bacterium]|nr:DNA/RNA non-specific endonuclease [Flavobacteriales bacterium]
MNPRALPLALFALIGPALWAQDGPEQRLRELQARDQELRTALEALAAPIDSLKLTIIRRDLRALALPALAPGDELVEHPGHLLVYSERHEQPKWTAHIATPDVITGNLARIDTFLMDTKVRTGTSTVEDYWFSGFDRGHLVPSADMRWNKEALTATYFYSNISPQRPEFNRDSWSDLEDWVRRTVRFGGERVFVVTGPVLREGLPAMDNPGHKNEVSIPEHFFKVLADLDGPERKMIGFVMRNGVNEYPTISYAVPVDSVERLTGLDLFPALDDTLEARLEAQRDPQAWYHPGDPFLGEVEPLPAPLPKGMFNTVQARHQIGRVATVCGTVVSTRRTQKANAVYLNFDRLHPAQDFYCTIWDSNGPNFHYDPEEALLRKRVCVTGKVTLYDDIPRISVNNENAILLWEEAVR